jgi:hypothetical protein
MQVSCGEAEDIEYYALARIMRLISCPYYISNLAREHQKFR